MENRTPDSEMWRVEVTHFTPWYLSWLSDPDCLVYPDMVVRRIEKCDDCPERNVSPASLTSGEDIPIPGAPLSLRYDSDRVQSLPTMIDIGAVGQSEPGGLSNIAVRAEIAGQVIGSDHAPASEVTERLLWDGRDFRGQPVTGLATANVSVGHTYGGDNGGPEIMVWDHQTVQINRAEPIIADGWSVSAHHQTNPAMPNELLKGDRNNAETDRPGRRHGDRERGPVGPRPTVGRGVRRRGKHVRRGHVEPPRSED